MGNFDDAGEDKGHDADVFGITATGRLEPSRDTGALVLGALGEGAMAAGVAFQARNVMMERDAFAEAESSNTRADTDNGPSGFVAEDARRRNGAKMDFFDVGGTNTAGRNFYEQFIGADARDRKGFETEIIYAAINDGLHFFWNCEHTRNLTRENDAEHRN